jgi:hypothetical protein
VLVSLALVAYAIYVYRRNEAPLRPAFRGLLALFRALTLVLLVVILCRPVLSLAFPGGAARGVLVLLDRSESLTLPGRNPAEARNDELIRAVQAIDDELGSSYPVAHRGFDTDLGPLIETLPPPPATGEATNLTTALERGLVEGGPEGRPGAMILVSDGTQTEGPDPVPLSRRLGIPVQVVGLGSPEPVPDLAITRVRVNLEAFVGERTPVEAVLRRHGLEGGSVQVRLLDVTEGEAELASATSSVESEGAEQRVSLSFVPTETGLRFLEIRVPELPGEATGDNNRRLVSIRVREEKTGVFILSGALTWDHTFLRRSLDADSTLAVHAGYWRGGRFRRNLGSPALPAIDASGLRGVRVVVLDHVTPAQLRAGAMSTLAGYVQGGGGLLILMGSGDGAVAQWMGSALEPLLPVQMGGAAAEEAQLRLTPEGRRHAVFDASVPGAPPLDSWTDLPPVSLAPDVGSVKAHGEALMLSAGNTAPRPVLSWARHGQGSVMALAAGGIWRWEFMSTAHGSGGNIMPGWWRRVAHWLARPGIETRLDIHPEEDVVSRGEAVTFVARVTDEAYQPVPGVDVDVTVTPAAGVEQEPRRVRLSGAEGFYSGVLEGLPPGRYRYQGHARTETEVLGTVEGVVTVDSLGTEMERLEADHELLERIAAVSGGRLWHPDSLVGLSESFSVMAEEEEERIQVAIWNHPLVFVAFVLFASLEWFLRRRRGLV